MTKFPVILVIDKVKIDSHAFVIYVEFVLSFQVSYVSYLLSTRLIDWKSSRYRIEKRDCWICHTWKYYFWQILLSCMEEEKEEVGVENVSFFSIIIVLFSYKGGTVERFNEVFPFKGSLSRKCNHWKGSTNISSHEKKGEERIWVLRVYEEREILSFFITLNNIESRVEV